MTKEGWATTYYSSDYQFFIRHTIDGGRTWEGQNIPLEVQERLKPASLHSVSFVNGEVGWAVGSRGIILHTRDGGRTWQFQESGMDIDLVDVQYVSGNEVFALGNDGTILKQENITSVRPQEKLIVPWGKIKRR
ncbi:TPA: hypothetical protein EYP66_24760 [Candidatus Poribacteria bacterium]|nr:hypothetical protein [Candidatus Poribacteria bacterium]